jgi:hypothetical protein
MTALTRVTTDVIDHARRLGRRSLDESDSNQLAARIEVT